MFKTKKILTLLQTFLYINDKKINFKKLNYWEIQNKRGKNDQPDFSLFLVTQ
jgi:hypothetical protein